MTVKYSTVTFYFSSCTYSIVLFFPVTSPCIKDLSTSVFKNKYQPSVSSQTPNYSNLGTKTIPYSSAYICFYAFKVNSVPKTLTYSISFYSTLFPLCFCISLSLTPPPFFQLYFLKYEIHVSEFYR